MTSEIHISVNAIRTVSEHVSDFPQFFYRRVNGNLLCKKVFDVDSANELRQQGFKLSAELWPSGGKP